MGIVDKIKETLHKDKSSEVTGPNTVTANTLTTTHHDGHHLLEDSRIEKVEEVKTRKPVATTTPLKFTKHEHEHEHHHHEEKPVLTETLETAAVTKQLNVQDNHTEVQPVIERTVIQPEIHQIVQAVKTNEHVHTTENVVEPVIKGKTISHEDTLDAKKTDEITKLTQDLALTAGKDTVEYLEKPTTQVVLEPIIHEKVEKRIIEHIQPVIEHTKVHTHHKQVIQPIEETVQAAPIVHAVQIQAPIDGGIMKTSHVEEDYHHHRS